MNEDKDTATLEQRCVFHWLNCLYDDFLSGRKSGEQMPCSSCQDRESCTSCPPLNFNIAGENLGLRVKYHKAKEQ